MSIYLSSLCSKLNLHNTKHYGPRGGAAGHREAGTYMTQDDFSTYPVAEQTGEKPAAELPEDAGAPEPDAPDGGDAAAARPRRKNWFARHKKLTVALVAVVVAAAVLLSRLLAAAPASTVTYQYIRTTTLQRTDLQNSVTATGTVVSGSEASVTASESARTYTVATVEVEVGDVVQEGDVIATLDTTDLQKQIDSAEQSYSDDLQSAQTTYDRAVESYEVAVVQHDNRLIDLQENIDDADKALADAQQALEDAKSARDSAQSTVNSAQSTVDSLQSAYNAAQGVASYVISYDAAADALTSATTALNNAYSSYTTVYMNYSSADDAGKTALKPTLEAAARSLESAWAAYGTGAGMADALSANASVSASNQRAVAATTAASIESVNAQLAGTNIQLSTPAADTLVENFKAAADALVAQESAAASGTGMTYQQVMDSYTAAQTQLTTARTTLTQAESQVTAAETQVETAETQVETAHDNYDTEKNSTTLTSSWQQVEDAKVRLEQAQRVPDNLTTLRDTLDDCTLTATMSGTITALNATVGSTCADTVATIQDTDGLTVEITVSADDVSDLSTGMSCTVSSDATGDAEITGTLTQIDPVANDQGSFGAKVRVDTADSGLLIGIQAQVEIVQDVTENVFVVPIDAVATAEDGSSYVYRQTGGEGVDMTFEEVTVTTGASNDYYIEISGDDLAEGDVIRATADLTEGIETATVDESAADMMGGQMTMEVMPSEGGGPGGGDMGGPGGDMGGGAPGGGMG